jgi:hypothetical protein
MNRIVFGYFVFYRLRERMRLMANRESNFCHGRSRPRILSVATADDGERESVMRLSETTWSAPAEDFLSSTPIHSQVFRSICDPAFMPFPDLGRMRANRAFAAPHKWLILQGAATFPRQVDCIRNLLSGSAPPTVAVNQNKSRES